MIKKNNSPKGVKLANGIFLGGTLFCFLVLVYALSRRGLFPAEAMYKYYIASVIGMTLCISALKLKEEIRINLAIGIISAIFCLYMVEVFLFLLEPIPWERHILREKAAKKAGIPYDTRTKWQVIQDLREKGIDAYPIPYPHRYLPNGLKYNDDTIFILGGISGKTTVLCNESGEYVIYSADEYGFNNPPKSWGVKQPELMLVGDSFVHGGCVKPGDDLTGQLRKFDWKALNIGMSGNGPLFELATLKEYAEPLKPKIVLWVYYEDNDFADLQKEKNSAFLMQYLREDFSQNLFNRQTEVDEVLRQHIEKQIKIYRPSNVIFEIIKLNHVRYKLKYFKWFIKNKIHPPDRDPEPDPLFREILKKARNRVSSWGGEFYFVYLPTWSRYANYANKVDHDQWLHRQEVLSIARGLGIPVIDLHQEVLLKHVNPLSLVPFSLYGHYNAEAYKLFAEAIAKHLNEK